MDIKSIINKMVAGETINDEEKQFAQSYDPTVEINGAAAAARRKADEQAALAKRQLEELQSQATQQKQSLMTDQERLAEQIKQLTQSVESIKQEKEEALKQAKTLQRKSAIKSVSESAGIKWVNGVNTSILDNALESYFGDIENITPEVAKPILEKFKTENAAVILDQSGHGVGSQARPAQVSGEVTMEDRAAQLRKSTQRK